MKKLLTAALLVTVLVCTSQTAPQSERIFTVKLSYSEMVNVMMAVRYNTSLSADASNRLADKLNTQINDTTMNPVPKPAIPKKP